MTTCPVCGAKSRDGLMCTACWRQLERDLRSVPGLIADLELAASKQARLTPPGPGGLASERNPVGWTATEALNHLRGTLVAWANRVDPERANRYSITSAHTLLRHQHAIRAHPAAAELWADITSHTHRARHTIDRQDRHIDIGDCPKPDCGGTLRAYLPAADDRPTTIGCLTDPTHAWSPDQWLRLGRILNAQAR